MKIRITVGANEDAPVVVRRSGEVMPKWAVDELSLSSLYAYDVYFLLGWCVLGILVETFFCLIWLPRKIIDLHTVFLLHLVVSNKLLGTEAPTGGIN